MSAVTSAPGVCLRNGVYNFPLVTNTGLSSAYVRFRIAGARKTPENAIKACTSSYYGFSLYYQKAKFYLRKYNGSSTPYETKELSVDPHLFNTYGFICDGQTMKLYVNGQYFDSTAVNGMYSNLTFTADVYSTIGSSVEVIAMYNTLHNDAQAVSATNPINSRYTAIIPDFSDRLMLYDHGNLCEKNSGGWLTNPYSSYPNTICEFAKDCIKINGVNASTSYFVAVQTKNHFDFSKYNRIYYLVSPSVHPADVTYNSDCMGTRCGYTTTTSPTINANRTLSLFPVGGLSGKDSGLEEDAFLLFLDISNLTNSQAILIADGSGLTNGKSAKIYAVWLQ